MNFEEAKSLATSLLEKVGVATVYYVDDYLSYDGLNSISGFIENSPFEELHLYLDIIPEEIISSKEAGIEFLDQVQSWWGSLSTKDQEHILSSLSIGSISQTENHIRQLLNGKCFLCTPEQWESSISQTCLEQIHSGQKVMLLFDYKLGEKTTLEGEGRNGLKLAQSFCVNEGVKENSFCGIFSKQFHTNEEFEFRHKYRDALSSWAFPVSKDRVPDGDEYSSFIEGLNNLLWVRHVDNLSQIAQELISKTSNRLKERFDDILPLDFKQVVISSSTDEGCRDIDTLLRLIHILFDRELRESLVEMDRGLEFFNLGVDAIKEIDSITNGSLAPRYDSEKVSRFFQDESFVPDVIVNTLLTPLRNGDVFCVNDSDYFVLLCQPCNISLRKGGKRGNNYDIGYFVPLKESNVETKLTKELNSVLRKSAGEQELAKKKFLGNIHKDVNSSSQGNLDRIKCSIYATSLCAAINEYKTVSLSLLDYCTFSEEGDVIINKPCSANLHANQKLLLKNHNTSFNESISLDFLLEGITDENRITIKPKIESWFYSSLIKIGAKPRSEDSRYIFPIKRYGHIQDPLASDLLTQLSHYISRAGLPSEFERR